MAYHFIAIASYYEGGTRIGWHYSSEENLDKSVIEDFLTKSKAELGKIDFGIHRLTTDSTSWESVYEKDSFFKDIYIADNMDGFIKLLKKDKEISALDIAKFFVTIAPITNLKLQKLIYFAYSTYLEMTSERLFSEKIIAYKYGPVVEEVYHAYKGYGRSEIEEDDTVFSFEELTVPMSLAKIAMSKDYVNVIKALTETISTYGPRTANQLVSISHAPDGPWCKAYIEGCNVEITDSLIASYSYKEKEYIETI